MVRKAKLRKGVVVLEVLILVFIAIVGTTLGNLISDWLRRWPPDK
jgi:membrane protein YqaA with SNARE-associated domain